MNVFPYRKVALFLAVSGLAMPGALADTDSVPPLATLIDQVVARDEATQKLLHSMQYDQISHTEQIGEKDQPIKKEDVKMIIRPGAAREVEVLSAKGDDLPSNPDEAADKAKGDELQRRKLTLSLRDLVTRFNVTYHGMTDISGQQAYLLDFEPKPDQPYHNQTEKVLNQLHGQIWVRARDSIILRTEATLTKPVEVAWFLASVESLDFRYELQSATNDLGPAWLATSVNVKTVLFSIRQKQTIEMKDFRPREK